MAKLAQIINYTKRLYTFDDYRRFLEKSYRIELGQG